MRELLEAFISADVSAIVYAYALPDRYGFDVVAMADTLKLYSRTGYSYQEDDYDLSHVVMPSQVDGAILEYFDVLPSGQCPNPEIWLDVFQRLYPEEHEDFCYCLYSQMVGSQSYFEDELSVAAENAFSETSNRTLQKLLIMCGLFKHEYWYADKIKNDRTLLIYLRATGFDCTTILNTYVDMLTGWRFTETIRYLLARAKPNSYTRYRIRELATDMVNMSNTGNTVSTISEILTLV